MIMELCHNQTLKELQKRRSRLTEFEVKTFLLQIVAGVAYLHENLIIHRDLKLGNIFISHKMELKLGDFGLSTRLASPHETRKTVCGTPNYIAPEILLEQGHSYEADIFSLGVILYTLVFGNPPFESDTVDETYENIKLNRYSFPKHVIVSAEVKDLVASLLQLDPAKRPTLEQIINHAFLCPAYHLPEYLPPYTLTVPPMASYIKQYVPEGFAVKITEMPRRLSSKDSQKRLEKCKSLDRYGLEPELVPD